MIEFIGKESVGSKSVGSRYYGIDLSPETATPITWEKVEDKSYELSQRIKELELDLINIANNKGDKSIYDKKLRHMFTLIHYMYGIGFCYGLYKIDVLKDL